MKRPGKPTIFFLLLVMAAPDEASALVLPLRFGEEGTFAVDVRNTTGDVMPLASFDATAIVSLTPDSYALETIDSPSCDIRNGSLQYMVPVQLRVGPLPPRSSVRCTVRVVRSAASNGPASINFNPTPGMPEGISLSDPDWLFGPVVDVALRVEQVAPFPLPGERDGILRVSIRNSGPWNIDKVDFGYCQDAALAPFDLDNDLPQGCAQASWGPTCWAVGGPSVEFGIAALAAGETKSCLLHAVAHEPLTEPVRFDISIVDTAFPAGEDVVLDFDRSNDSATLELAPVTSNDNAAPVDALGISSKTWLCLLLGAVAMARLSWRKHTKKA